MWKAVSPQAVMFALEKKENSNKHLIINNNEKNSIIFRYSGHDGFLYSRGTYS